MCSEEKKAGLWSSYLNSQYSILWEHARTCGNEDTVKCTFYRALATFNYSSETEEVGKADVHRDSITFRKPQLLFLCNHSVILVLTVEDGTLTAAPGATDAEGKPIADISLKDKHAWFRMSFTRTHVMGRDSKIDDQAADHEVKMVVLDFDKATLVSETNLEPAIAQFFKNYLKFLRKAGHHVLFGLPDFTDQKILATLPVDYARLPKVLRDADGNETTFVRERIAEFSVGVTYSNVTVEQINTYLHATQHGGAELRAQEKRDVLASSIFKVRWAYQESMYDVVWEAPSVIPLCPHELLFVFHLKELRAENQTEAELADKVIVFVVNVSEFDGKTLRVDFRSARYISFYSTLEITEESTVHTSFLEWIRTSYLEILTKYSYNVIYSVEEEKPRAMVRDGGFWRRVHNVTDFLAVRRHSESAIWADRSQHIFFSSVHQAFALTERSIEHLLRIKWEQKVEHQLWQDGNFKARIAPLRIHLLSGNKMVIFVDIENIEIQQTIEVQSQLRSAHMPPMEIFSAKRGRTEAENEAQRPVAPPRSFRGILAFEVTLQIHSDVHNTQSYIFDVDMPSAQPIDELTDIWDVATREKTDETTTTTIRGHVFQHLTDAALVTIGNISSTVATSFSLSILSEKEITIQNFLTNQLDVSDSSLIVLYACTEETADNVNFKWSPGWLPSAEANGIGTVWVSKQMFINRILDVFRQFNAATTMVRSSDGNGFETLEKRDLKEATPKKLEWRPNSTYSSAECLAYGLYYNYNATRKEIGTHVKHNWDSVSLRTENYVWIPTEIAPNSPDIVMALTGIHEIRASRKGFPDRTATVMWKLTIIITMTSQGLNAKITIVPEMLPPNEDPIIKSDFYSPGELIMNQLEGLTQTAEKNMNTNLSAISTHNWFSMEENHFHFSNPIFTRSGDFVYEVYKTSTTTQETTSEQTSSQQTTGQPPQQQAAQAAAPQAAAPQPQQQQASPTQSTSGPTSNTLSRPATPQTGPPRGGGPGSGGRGRGRGF